MNRKISSITSVSRRKIIMAAFLLLSVSLNPSMLYGGNKIGEEKSESNYYLEDIAIATLIMVPTTISLARYAPYGNRDTDIEYIGDLLQIAISTAGISTVLIYEGEHKREGAWQFIKAMATSQIITEGLKLAIDKERPCGGSMQSFPSSHASAAFTGASFIHRRYGWKPAIPAYIGAGFVGYSRVYADKHYVEDVLAGAAIGILSSFLLVEPYQNVTIAPHIARDFMGPVVSARF